MVLQLDNDQARKQREQEKLLLQMQLNARGNQDATDFLRAKQADVANVTYMRQEAARRAQAERVARQRDMYADQREYGQQIGLQNNAAGIASNAATQAGSTARRHAELVDKLQRGQLDVNQKHELEQLTIKQIQELEQMRVGNQLGQGDMRLQDDLQRGQNEQRQGFAMEGKAADYGYGALDAAQQQQYGMQNAEAEFGYKTREQAQRDAQAAAMAEYQARQQMEQAKQQHGYNLEGKAADYGYGSLEAAQQHGNTMEQQGQQNDFYLGRDSLADLRQSTAASAAKLEQLNLPPAAARRRDKRLAELQQIQSQTPSGGQTGARHAVKRLGDWGQAVLSDNFESQVVPEPTPAEDLDRRAVYYKGGRPITAEQMRLEGADSMILDGKRVELQTPATTKVNENDEAVQFNTFRAGDATKKRVPLVVDGKTVTDDFGAPILTVPSWQDSVEEWERQKKYFSPKQELTPEQAPHRRELPDAGYEQGRFGVQAMDMFDSPPQQQRQQNPPGAPGDVVQYAPRDQQQAPVNPRMQAAQAAGFQPVQQIAPEQIANARRTMQAIMQQYPNAQTLQDLPPEAAQAYQMALEIAKRSQGR